MIDFYSLASIALAFFVVAVTPGPANISNATIAMSRGRKTSLVYSTGLSTGLVFWGLIAASGMHAVLQASVYLLTSIKVLGGLYLLWLAYLSAKAAMRAGGDNNGSALNQGSGKSWFARGLLLNLSNPKSAIAWLAALSVGMEHSDGTDMVISAFLVCVLVGFTNNALYSIAFSVNGVMSWYRRFCQSINSVVAGLFALAGIGLLRSAFSRNPT